MKILQFIKKNLLKLIVLCFILTNIIAIQNVQVFAATGTIIGKIYNDLNQNGFQDADEPDFDSTFNLLPVGTTVTTTNITNPTNTFISFVAIDGTYSQTVAQGQYSVRVNVSSDYRISSAINTGAESNPTIVTVSSGQVNSAGNDGIYQKHEIVGSIYPDYNNNGIQEIGESYSPTNPIPTGTFVKIACNSSVFGTPPLIYFPVIDLYGNYFQQSDFSGDSTLCEITIIPSAGFQVSNSTELDNGFGSNPTEITAYPESISVSQGKDGLYQIPTSMITGKIYPDLNGNGIQDPNEPDYSTSNPSPSSLFTKVESKLTNFFYYLYLTVNSNGSFEELLPTGSYDLQIGVFENGLSVSQFDPITNNNKYINLLPFTLGNNQTINLGNFGLYSEPDYLPNIYSGYVYEDLNNNGIKEFGEKGIEGVKLIIEGEASDGLFYYTDANGKYNIPYGISENQLVIKEFQPLQYNDGIDTLGLHATSSNDDEIYFDVGYYGFSVNNNFGERPKPIQVQAGGGMIAIATNPKSSISSTQNITSNQPTKPIEPVTTATGQSIELTFTKNYRRSGTFNQVIAYNQDSLEINDPYICESQIITGKVKYTSDKANLNPVVLKIKNFNANQNSYTSQVQVDINGDYQLDIKDVQKGNYQVEFSVSDKLGNIANGTYTFEKKDICSDDKQLTKGSQASQSQINNLSLPRSGSNTSSFIYALVILLCIMFIGSQTPLITVKASFNRNCKRWF